MKQSEYGLTLIESLVALLVLSIGLLGTAHLMATGMKFTNSSFARTQATYIAENLAESMRANPDAIVNFSYNNFDSNNIASCTAKPNPYCAADGSTIPAACTSAQLATFDLYQATCGTGGTAAGNALKQQLPNGRMLVNCDDAPCTATSTYTITVSWDETELGNNDTDVTNTKTAQFVILP